MTMIARRQLVPVVLAFALASRAAPVQAQYFPSGNFTIDLWPGGVVHYRFAEVGDVDPLNGATIPAAQVVSATLPVDKSYRVRVTDQMARWRTALKVTNPADNIARPYITFVECVNCEGSYVFIRLNFNYEGDQNMCSYRTPEPERIEMPGRNPNGATVLHFNGVQDTNTVLHELGHCLGLWHEFNRQDWDSWLLETDDWIDKTPEIRPLRYMPLLGNYDYDSVMHYGSRQTAVDERRNVLMFTDPGPNEFNRRSTESNYPDEAISRRDRSRVLQYYAREREPNWGFFFSLATAPQDPDDPPDPYLAPDVRPTGTPAIVHHQGQDFDLFVRGDDRHLYWRSFREQVKIINNVPFMTYQRGAWASVGCCFGSDPAAISRRTGEMDLFAIGAFTGKLELTKYRNGQWGTWQYIQGGYPTGGIKQAPVSGSLGPAVASRAADSMDVFVIGTDGVLAVTTLDGNRWTDWRRLGDNYSVTARPAAVALSATNVQLALNVNGTSLYEPSVRFPLPADQFSLGLPTARNMAENTPAALTTRNDVNSPYRVLITNAAGRVSHRVARGSWRDIGGIPLDGTGPAAVATGSFSAYIVINNEDATTCDASCVVATGVNVDEARATRNTPLQPGGLWLRKFQ